MNHRVLRLPQVLDRTGLTRSSLYRLHAAGVFPRRVQISERSVGWVESEVEAWLAARVSSSRPVPAADPARATPPSVARPRRREHGEALPRIPAG